MLTYGEITKLLGAAGIDDPGTDAGVLIGRFCGIPPHELLWRRGEDFPSPELADAVRRRVGREPLQYIVGEWEFMGLPFYLNGDCLCPRADTELTAGTAIEHLPRGGRFCDVGTGSGAIAVSVLYRRSDLRAVAADISDGALDAARRNAERHGVADRLTLIRGDALKDGFLREISGGEPFDAVISNPPYIPSGDIPGLAPEVLREPRRALDGGTDGLVFYRALTAGAAEVLSVGGFVLYEVGAGQADDVCGLGEKYGFACRVFRDLSGIERTVMMRK